MRNIHELYNYCYTFARGGILTHASTIENTYLIQDELLLFNKIQYMDVVNELNNNNDGCSIRVF